MRRLDAPDASADVSASRRPPWLFLLLVVLPILAAAVYLFIFAADRYTSEASYVVRKGGDAILSSAFAVPGMSRSDESSEVIKVYFQSRDAAEHLAQDVDLEAMLSRAPSDFLTVYPGIFYDESREGLFAAMQDTVSIDINDSTGISTLSVTAYTPEDARAIATSLLDEAEQLVNRMNDRATSDTIQFAQSVVAEDEARVRDIQTRMTDFRNDESILDPNAQSTSQIELMTNLSQQLTEVDTEIAQLKASAPKNPRLNSLNEQRDALARQVEKVRNELAGSTDSLAPKLSAYENLSLERELAIQALTTSYRSLETARQEAFAERLYLQTISSPNLPDRASHPRVGLVLLITAAFAVAAHQIAKKLLANTMEHMP
ncbi:hypothetical protein [Jiella marina]|uniref:hypothetical protein n=1 Tax=Jiella sp. LLJ827 TaxID=2917712 RepID=UPI0021010656|nr:hypothetical protein [Jiella sp. LLJ827]MCQ0990288.1 hypothetical protein [Jiella sp. LLJ827]